MAAPPRRSSRRRTPSPPSSRGRAPSTSPSRPRAPSRSPLTDTTSSSITGTASGIAVQAGSGITGNPDATATTFADPVGSSASGQAVTLTATVKATGSGVANPTDGSVSFYQGATLLGTVNLSGSDQATYSAGPLTAGTYTFFAAYNGDAATYQPSASPAFSQVVDHFATNLTLSSSLAHLERRPAVDVHGDGHRCRPERHHPADAHRHRHFLRRRDRTGHRRAQCLEPGDVHDLRAVAGHPRDRGRVQRRQSHPDEPVGDPHRDGGRDEPVGRLRQLGVGGRCQRHPGHRRHEHAHHRHRCLRHHPGGGRRRGRRGDRQRPGRDLFRAGHDRPVADPRRRGGVLDHAERPVGPPPAAARSRSSAIPSRSRSRA